MTAQNKWTADKIPDQTGKTVVVTGANIGLGYQITRELARRGATVVMACRDPKKAEEAANALRRELPKASLDLQPLDLADLASVQRFADTISQRYSALHILSNNAGVMALPYRQTADGFEMQFGTNHLGHFALTGLLLPLILATPQARVVTTSSFLHRSGEINFADLEGKVSYDPNKAYSQSKLANLLFAYELQRKFATGGTTALSLAAHPGYAATNLQFVGPNMQGSAFRAALMSLSNRFIAQSAARGALPTLFAATSPDVQGGDYIGPDGFNELRGYPKKVRSAPQSYDLALAAKLWSVSEELTGVHYNSLVA